MILRKSMIAAKELGISYHQLNSLLHAEKMTSPQKDSSGDYIWTDADMEAAREALKKGRRRKKTDVKS